MAHSRSPSSGRSLLRTNCPWISSTVAAIILIFLAMLYSGMFMHGD
jgi:hypothetical protein